MFEKSVIFLEFIDVWEFVILILKYISFMHQNIKAFIYLAH